MFNFYRILDSKSFPLNDMTLTVKERVEAFKRQLLTEALAQLPEENVKRFHQIFPKGVKEEDLVNAIELCERTILKNKKS